MPTALSRRAFLAAVAAVSGVRERPAGAEAGADDVMVRLGETPVHLVHTGRPPFAPTYASLHENEQTAVAAASRLVERRGGRLIELKAQRQRLVTFTLDGARYTFDPNRIFTDVGIRKTLRRYGAYAEGAHAAVRRLAMAVQAHVLDPPSAHPVVAVHNNTRGALSVQSYRPGGELQAEAADVSVSPGRDPDDFFLVTGRALFERLRGLGFNVVLQHPTPTDDGSLSVYCQDRVPYVNVEARFDHLGEQVAMLEALHPLLAVR